MTINLDEITRALDEATPGPWKKHESPHIKSAINHGEKHIAMVNYSHRGLPSDVFGAEHDANAHLIAHAPGWLRLLVERVRKLEKVAEAAGGVASSVLVAKECSKHRKMAEYISSMNEATGPEMDTLIKALVSANVPGWEK